MMTSVATEGKPSSPAKTAKGEENKSNDKNKEKIGTKKDLRPGTIRFGRERRKIINKILKPRVRKVQKKDTQSPKYITKPVGGENNGGTRMVLVKKPRSYYPTEDKTRRRREKKKPKGSYLKKSLIPGRVCIIVAGPHKGKRVVFLKQIPESGLCIITGPYGLNNCPLRRINQIYLITTKIRIGLGKDFKVPEHINDKYFKKINLNKKKPKKDETDIFDKKPKKYIPSLQKLKDQSEMDKIVSKSIRKRKDKHQLCAYLCSKFSLKNRQYPHAIKF